jgi:hypothetical protein
VRLGIHCFSHRGVLTHMVVPLTRPLSHIALGRSRVLAGVTPRRPPCEPYPLRQDGGSGSRLRTCPRREARRARESLQPPTYPKSSTGPCVRIVRAGELIAKPRKTEAGVRRRGPGTCWTEQIDRTRPSRRALSCAHKLITRIGPRSSKARPERQEVSEHDYAYSALAFVAETAPGLAAGVFSWALNCLPSFSWDAIFSYCRITRSP